MSTTAEQMRAWTGPAILTYGFRPFFLGGAIWAALAMALTAGRGTQAIFVALVPAVAFRLLGATMPVHGGSLHALSGLAWIAAFGGFCTVYGPALLTARPDR